MKSHVSMTQDIPVALLLGASGLGTPNVKPSRCYYLQDIVVTIIDQEDMGLNVSCVSVE